MHRRLNAALPLALGAAGVVLTFGHLLRPGRALIDRDLPFLHLPFLTTLAALTRHGAPYWNPLIHGGQPALANPHYAAFYPPIWLALLVPPHVAINLLIVAHVVWAFWGTWRLTRRWGSGPFPASLAGLAWVAGGAFSSSPNMLNLFLGLAWLPWVMYWGDGTLHAEARRDWLAGACRTSVALAAQLLAGGPVIPLISLLTLACLCLEVLPGRARRVLRLLPVAPLALMLAAVQLVPTARHLAESPRASGLDIDHATIWSTPPRRLAEWIWPHLHGDPMLAESQLYFGYPGSDRGVPLILSIHCGFLVLALACAPLLMAWKVPRRRALVTMVLLGVCLALGRFNPLYTAVVLKLPPFNLVRFPEKFLLLSVFGIVLLGALGWDALLTARRRTLRLRLAVPRALAIAAILASLVFLALPFAAPQRIVDLVTGDSPQHARWVDGEEMTDELPPRVLRARTAYLGRETFASLWLWIATLVLLELHRRRALPWRVLAVVVVAFVGLDLWYFGRHQNLTVPASEVLEPPATLHGLTPATGRIFSDEVLFGDQVFVLPEPQAAAPSSLRSALQRLDPYAANLWGFGYALNEDTDLMLTRWARHALHTFHLRSDLAQKGWNDRAYRYLGAWNIGLVVRRRAPQALLEEQQQTGTAPSPVRLLRNPFQLPRYRLVPQVFFEADLAAAAQRAASLDFDLSGADAVVDPRAREGPAAVGFDPEARIVSLDERPSEVVLGYRSTGPAFLVAAVTFDRDWRARIDGEPATLYPTGIGQMGVELPAGAHRLELRFRDPSLPLGAGLSLAGLVVCALVHLPRRMRHRD